MSAVLQNDLLLRAARGEFVERPPVWLMRQAGRILKEYRQVREQAGSFIQLVTNPELAAEVTVQPVDLLGVDAAIIFSDILVIPEAMGAAYEMEENKGPRFPNPIRTAAQVEQLQIARPAESLSYVTDAIRIAKQKLNGRVPLIGFAGAPWTIMAYLVEGSGSKTFSWPRRMLVEEPGLSHQLLNKITESTIAYLHAQVDAGADLVQIFDSWAGILGPDQYQQFALPYVRRICEALSPRVPVTVFALGAWFALEDIAECGCQTVGIDWHTLPEAARVLCGDGVTLQGNLDPAVLYAPAETINAETRRMVERFGTQRYIANLGHGVYPDVNPDAVRVFVEAVRSINR